MSIQYEVLPSPEAAAQRVADLIAEHLRQTASPRLGLATGGTPVPVYQELIRRTNRGELDWSSVETFNLDEYVGLSPADSRSYHAYMRMHLFDHVNIDPARTHLPHGATDDPREEADRYERLLASRGGVTLQLLGIGENGHIGFNEPGSLADSRTRVVDLATSTIQANSRYFDSFEDVPRQAITMGIATILDAGEIILLATGSAKAAVVASAINDPVTVDNPASLLNRHARVRFILDQAASSLLDV